VARGALARLQPAKRQGHGKHRSKSSHDLSQPDAPKSQPPIHHFQFLPPSITPTLRTLRASSQHRHHPTKHQLSRRPRAFFYRTVSSPSRCLSNPLSPSRFSPASSLPRPISPSIPHPSSPLFEVSSLVFGSSAGILLMCFNRSMVPGRIQHLQDPLWHVL
jgi:hypothetical protein